MTDTPTEAPLPPTSQVLDDYDALCQAEGGTRIIELARWSIPADEDGVIRLSGQVFGDPRRINGTQICTTRVAKAEGRTITTRSGTMYRLGYIDPSFLKRLRETLPGWDPENPVVMPAPAEDRTRRETRMVMRLPKGAR